MKITKSLLICFMCVVICFLSSCSEILREFDSTETFDREFKESFAQEYQKAEPNLMYLSAKRWETTIEIEPEQSHYDGYNFYKLAEINDIPDLDYVAAIQSTPNVGQRDYSISIYTRENITSHLLSWRVKSVSVIALTGNEFSAVSVTSFEGDWDELAQTFVKNPLQYHLDHGAIELVTFDKQEHGEIIQSLQKSFQSRETYDRIGAPHTVLHYKDEGDAQSRWGMTCFILVRFEESENLIWVAKLCQNKEGTSLFFDCSDHTNVETKCMAEIDSVFAQEILAHVTGDGTM